jgi:hypothetical protein
MLNRADTDKDGQISFKEFVVMMIFDKNLKLICFVLVKIGYFVENKSDLQIYPDAQQGGHGRRRANQL